MTSALPPSPQVEIVHRFELSAAHRLESPELSPEENARVYGACYTDHGHNYEVEVAVLGSVSARTGMVMNLVELMGIVRERIFAQADHKHLNRDVPFLNGVIPTAENLAVAIWTEIEPDLREYECKLSRVRVYESRANFVEYRGANG
jgi:6-pyruvoyltetrahydropterin/6-carboxytetrahydropterin synthase